MTLDSTNYSRYLVLNEFERQVVPIFGNKFFRVAVVGGDSKEPELFKLIVGELNFDVSFFGIAANSGDFIF